MSIHDIPKIASNLTPAQELENAISTFENMLRNNFSERVKKILQNNLEQLKRERNRRGSEVPDMKHFLH